MSFPSSFPAPPSFCFSSSSFLGHPPSASVLPLMEEEFNENIVKGCQRMAMKLVEGEKLAPLNELVESDEKASEKIALVYEQAKTIIFSLATQVF